MTTPDPEREVPLLDDTDLVVLPDEAAEVTELDWLEDDGEDPEVRLLESRPPHWDH